MSDSQSTDFDTVEKIQASLDSSPFSAFCGMRVADFAKESGRLAIVMPMRPELERLAGSGQFHGGPIAALIDTAGCYACMMSVGHGVPTVNFRTDYLRPAVKTSLRAVATVRRAGRTVCIVDVDVLNAAGQLVAIGRATFSTGAAG